MRTPVFKPALHFLIGKHLSAPYRNYLKARALLLLHNAMCSGPQRNMLVACVGPGTEACSALGCSGLKRLNQPWAAETTRVGKNAEGGFICDSAGILNTHVSAIQCQSAPGTLPVISVDKLVLRIACCCIFNSRY